MTSEEFQPYPGSYSYEPFGAAGYPGGPTPGKPPPRSVTYAFYLMLTGATLTLVGLLYDVAHLTGVRERATRTAHGKLTDSQNDAIIAVAFAISLIFVALWIWMAFSNRAGKNWARITGTVLFGLSTLSILYSTIRGNETGIAAVITFLTWLVGLATVILLWIKESSAHFRPAPVYMPYPPVPHPTAPHGF
ncbi:hypothetical protein [Nocardia sp. NPDC006630]|uniref:hypothetical protein n=1 Tax=Nocardia sp. NPDC006630 TaxID=3157181 RepID=UPI0033B0159B